MSVDLVVKRVGLHTNPSKKCAKKQKVKIKLIFDMETSVDMDSQLS